MQTQLACEVKNPNNTKCSQQMLTKLVHTEWHKKKINFSNSSDYVFKVYASKGIQDISLSLQT